MSNNPYLEKSASLLAAGALTHIGQNVVTNKALHSKRVAQYLGDAFQQGYHGVSDTSLSSRVVRGVSSAITPDISAAHKSAHVAGGKLRELLESHGATPKHHAGIRMMVEGRFEDLAKRGLHNDPLIRKAHDLINPHIPLPDLHTLDDPKKVHDLHKIWNDKSHPLLSNIAKGMARGSKPVGDNFRKGELTQKLPLLTSAAVGAVDPAAGAINGVKALSLSPKFNESKLGKKVTELAHEHLIKSPIMKGVENPGKVNPIVDKASTYLINPTSAHLRRTSAAVSEAVGGDAWKAQMQAKRNNKLEDTTSFKYLKGKFDKWKQGRTASTSREVGPVKWVV